MPHTEMPWDLMILDGRPSRFRLGSLAVGDVDGDGHLELLVGTEGEGLLWYRPATGDRGRIGDGPFGVGLALKDLTGDGRLDVFAGRTDGEKPNLWFTLEGPTMDGPWHEHVLDAAPGGNAHDLVFADVDGDGQDELVANAVGRDPFALFCYKPDPSDPTRPWHRSVIQQGRFTEGVVVRAFAGTGSLQIVSGPDLWLPPDEGGDPLTRPWRHIVLAPSLREMVRVAAVDITGTGRPDLVIAESEYYEGRAVWLENRMAEDPARPWIERPLIGNLYYAHTLEARRDVATGEVTVLLAEMAEGGWGAPRNHDARVMELVTRDAGQSWQTRPICRGSGTHQALPVDLDGDGRIAVVGKQWARPRVQVFKRRPDHAWRPRFDHRLVDRDKPAVATDLVPVDLTGDGRTDVACGRWWYENRGPGAEWPRHEIPGVCQAVAAGDVDGNGRAELVATLGDGTFSAELAWLRPIDPRAGRWDVHPIGTGSGDWPHGTCLAPLLPGGRLALACAWHSADQRDDWPTLWEVPDDPSRHTGPWPQRTLAEIPYGEELVAADLTGDGTLDLVAGPWWLENRGDGRFAPHRLVAEEFHAARVAVADLTGNGRPDIVLGEERLDFQNKVAPPARLVWLENPADAAARRDTPWPLRDIDTLRCPHSIGVADLDGDGRPEIVVGEHDPFKPYRHRCRLLVYKAADAAARSWWRWTLDDRFEHHDGAKVFQSEPGRWTIASHGWKDVRYVHLWEMADEA